MPVPVDILGGQGGDCAPVLQTVPASLKSNRMVLPLRECIRESGASCVSFNDAAERPYIPVPQGKTDPISALRHR